MTWACTGAGLDLPCAPYFSPHTCSTAQHRNRQLRDGPHGEVSTTCSALPRLCRERPENMKTANMRTAWGPCRGYRAIRGGRNSLLNSSCHVVDRAYDAMFHMQLDNDRPGQGAWIQQEQNGTIHTTVQHSIVPQPV